MSLCDAQKSEVTFVRIGIKANGASVREFVDMEMDDRIEPGAEVSDCQWLILEGFVQG